jgi:hypothetical protein
LDTRTRERGSLVAVEPSRCLPGPVRERGHVVQFYTDDAYLLDGLGTLFMDALNAGESIVAMMTKSHGIDLQRRLRAQGMDGAEAKQKGRLTVLDAVKTLSRFMDADGPNRQRFLLQVGDILRRAETAAVAKEKPVVVYGEMVAVLGEQKKFDAIVRLEQLWNELALTRSFHLCCAYPATLFQEERMGEVYAAICSEHSDVAPLSPCPPSSAPVPALPGRDSEH